MLKEQGNSLSRSLELVGLVQAAAVLCEQEKKVEMKQREKNIRNIGHFHIGDVPARHEPGTGEIHFKNVLRAIRETGFKDFVAMEYVPSKDAMLTLAEVRELAFGSKG